MSETRTVELCEHDLLCLIVAIIHAGSDNGITVEEMFEDAQAIIDVVERLKDR